MQASPASATADQILIAAESLFTKFGYTNVSLRKITLEAGVNLAAVNYHFYDKESLYREILTRRLRQINAARLGLLQAAEAKHHPANPPLPEIMDALARPVFLPTGDLRTPASLLGRLLIDRLPFTETLLQAEFQPAMTRFGQAIRRHVPTLPPADFLWRISFVVGALHHALLTLPDMRNLTQGICRPDDPETALTRFVDFATSAIH